MKERESYNRNDENNIKKITSSTKTLHRLTCAEIGFQGRGRNGKEGGGGGRCL